MAADFPNLHRILCMDAGDHERFCSGLWRIIFKLQTYASCHLKYQLYIVIYIYIFIQCIVVPCCTLRFWCPSRVSPIISQGFRLETTYCALNYHVDGSCGFFLRLHYIISHHIVCKQYPILYLHSIFDKSIIIYHPILLYHTISHDGLTSSISSLIYHHLSLSSYLIPWSKELPLPRPEENRPRAIFRSPELRRRRVLGPELSGTLAQEEWVQAPTSNGDGRAIGGIPGIPSGWYQVEVSTKSW